MLIDIWSDIVCPFCYIGKANLEAALAQAGVEAKLRHRAFRLQPGLAPMPVADMLARKYGLRGAEAAAQQARIVAMAAQAGLDFRLDGARIGDTLDAHRLVRFAAGHGRDGAMVDRLYRAYFSEGRDIFDRKVLVALGMETGLDRADMTAMLESGDFAGDVAADQGEAARLDIRGVPFVVIDARLAVSGAQPVAAFVAALRQASPAGDSGVCGTDGCELPD